MRNFVGLNADERSTTPVAGAMPERALLGGYFVVAAKSEERAVEIASGSPHVAHGGWIEVAPILSR